MANQLWTDERIKNRLIEIKWGRVGTQPGPVQYNTAALEQLVNEMRDEYEALLPDAKTRLRIQFICDVLQGYDAANIYFREIEAIRKWLERLENT